MAKMKPAPRKAMPAKAMKAMKAGKLSPAAASRIQAKADRILGAC